jgi:hypothetical protein
MQRIENLIDELHTVVSEHALICLRERNTPDADRSVATRLLSEINGAHSIVMMANSMIDFCAECGCALHLSRDRYEELDGQYLCMDCYE